MTQIGIGLVHCFTSKTGAGYNRVYVSDDGAWTQLIDDTGEVFRHVKVAHDSVIRMVRIISDGWILCSMRPVTGIREDEYRAAWLYVPSDLDISVNELNNVIEEMEMYIRRPEFNAAALTHLAQSTARPMRKVLRYSVPKSQSGYAIKYIGGGNISLKEMLAMLYQEEFVKYSWVMLLERDNVSLTPTAKVTDLSSSPLHTPRLITPSGDKPAGFTIYINDRPFDRPVWCFGANTLKATLRKAGYRDIIKLIGPDGSCNVDPREIMRILKQSDLKFENEKGVPIKPTKIEIAVAEVDVANKCWYIPLSKCESLAITVTAEGYRKSPMGTVNLTQIEPGQPVTVKLREDAYNYSFELTLKPVRIGDPKALITFDSTFNHQLSTCPFEGYSMSTGSTPRLNGVNKIERTPRTVSLLGSASPVVSSEEKAASRKLLLMFVSCVVAALLVGGLAGWWIFSPSADDQPVVATKQVTVHKQASSNPETSSGTSSSDETQPSTSDNNADDITDLEKNIDPADLAKAISILDKGKLKKSESEENPALKGLWDMLNNYQLKEVLYFFKSHKTLAETTFAKKILPVIEQSPIPPVGETFNQPGDLVITATGYHNRLMKMIPPTTQQPAPQHAGTKN